MCQLVLIWSPPARRNPTYTYIKVSKAPFFRKLLSCMQLIQKSLQDSSWITFKKILHALGSICEFDTPNLKANHMYQSTSILMFSNTSIWEAIRFNGYQQSSIRSLFHKSQMSHKPFDKLDFAIYSVWLKHHFWEERKLTKCYVDRIL